ncbi:iron ABC transporter permease [Psychrobacter sp. HD31]|uniref:ABC transporter permease n=1 Tax=Psychrobacter sp. HD31 TaxID=3112003 RepID=UPI003DA2CE21
MADIWQHLAEYVLPSVLKNTSIMLAMVLVIAGTLGTVLAWFTSMYQFWGQKFFSWALMLPLAMPAYVLSFVVLGMLDFSSPLQTAMREAGISWALPSIRNIWGAGIIMSLSFYPYVYLLARQAFLSQGKRAIEAGQMLGLNRRQVFFKLALPQALPWLIGGLLLACMETLADFGAVSVFNVDTFTTAIYKAWFGFFSLTTAAQLSALLIVVVFFIVILEQYWQSLRANLATGDNRRLRASLPAQIFMFVLCTLVFVCAFLFPFIQLCVWTYQNFAIDFNRHYLSFVKNSMVVATSATLLVAVIAVVMAWLKRALADKSSKVLIALANLGYVVPGTVLAVGVFVPIAWLDNQLIGLGITSKPVVSGSVFVMIIALATRFLTVSFQPIDRQLQRLSDNQESAARLLTDSKLKKLTQVILPVLRPGILTALLIGFVEVMKEMPITLMTRSQGWDTLAVRVFQMTSEGMWGRAALPSLLIVLVGLLPVWILIHQTDKLK